MRKTIALRSSRPENVRRSIRRTRCRVESKALTNAIAALPLDCREVLILRELERLSYRDVACIVDIPIGMVMARLARARELLLQQQPSRRAAN